ncbi:MAG: transporter substrate-binding domain-containing protein [Mesorhizobium sp.]|nr:MAG: transporter substrate-binding domain-containing protein [Mesorhizobium sp.]
MAALGIAAVAISSMASSASAQSLLERIKNGDTIRLGFSNGPPLAYPGPNNEPVGFVNAMTLDILKKLGTTKVEAVVAEWGSLIPGLKAGRFDIITGGMSILPERCRNVLFSEPISSDKNSLIVLKGNPEGLHSVEDLRDKGLTIVLPAGSSAVKEVQDLGFADDKVMQVAGPPEMVQAVKAGRAAGGSLDHMTAVKALDNSVELADPFISTIPADHAAIVFPLNEQPAVDAFNAVLKDYLGSDEMLRSAGKYGYTKADLPDGTTTAQACKG